VSKFSKILQFCAAALLLCGAGTANAALVTYNYTVTGDVQNADSGAYGLNIGDTITAYGTFTADLSGGATVSFGSGSGNTMTIDLNGTLLSASDDNNYGAGSNPYLTFDNTQALTDFDYFKTSTTPTPAFDSSFLYFDDFDLLVGQWRSNVQLTAVPLPATLWLFATGFLGLAGIAGRKRKS